MTIEYGRMVQHALGCVKNSRQHDRYSVIAIMLRYIFALSHKASTLWRKVIALGLRKPLSIIVVALGSYETLSLFILMALKHDKTDKV